MSEEHWKQVAELENLLRVPFIVTKKLQTSDLTQGQFFKEWKALIYRLTEIGGFIADDIRKSMVQIELTLLDNKILLAAIYVDPMYRVIRTENQLNRAKSFLCDVAIRIEGLSLQEDAVDNSRQLDMTTGHEFESSGISNVQSSSASSEDEYEQFLNCEEISRKRRCIQAEESESHNPSEIQAFQTDFLDALNHVDSFDISSKLKVRQAINQYPEIVQKAATAVTALPPTQVSVERLFSALRLVKSELRSQMKEDLVDAILFLKTNLTFF